MILYYVIEHETIAIYNGVPLILISGEKCLRTEFVRTRHERTQQLSRAKHFATREAAQKYIDKWLSKMDGEFIIKGYDY